MGIVDRSGAARRWWTGSRLESDVQKLVLKAGDHPTLKLATPLNGPPGNALKARAGTTK